MAIDRDSIHASLDGGVQDFHHGDQQGGKHKQKALDPGDGKQVKAGEEAPARVDRVEASARTSVVELCTMDRLGNGSAGSCYRAMRFPLFVTPVVLVCASLLPAATPGPEKKDAAVARAGVTFEIDGHKAFVYAAPVPAKGKPWLWYAPTLKGVSLMQRKVYVENLHRAGIGIAGFDLGEVRGAPGSTAAFTRFYDEMLRRGWSAHPILLGQSRGGLMMLAWAVRHPAKVSAFVGIYPVCNLATWGMKNKAVTLADYGLPEAELVPVVEQHEPIGEIVAAAVGEEGAGAAGQFLKHGRREAPLILGEAKPPRFLVPAHREREHMGAGWARQSFSWAAMA